MNASDIVLSKQNGILYKAYYKPTVYQSTTYNTSCVVLDASGIAVLSTCVNTVNTYASNPFSSYELAADVNQGKYVCGTCYKTI